MKYLAAIFVLAAASLALAQSPTPTQRTVAHPAITLPALDADSAAALGPLATQRQGIAAQLQTLIAQYNSVNAQWRIAEGKALANAGLDPGTYGVDPTGTKFIKRVGPPSRN